ncbi:MAG: Hint domain-containing protein, partial [Pseudomonadota bacterium]
IMPVMPPPPCFLPETLIATPDGEMAAGDLEPGDMVTTLDHGTQQILWSGRRTVLLPAGIDRDRPILIRAGSLGSRQPNRDLKLSPRHHLFFDCDRSSGRSAKGLLAPAKGLTRLPGIRYMRGKRSVTYISLLMARHEVIFAEGQPVESFFPGPTAMQMLDSRMQAEIYALFPGLMTDPLNGYGTRARPLLKRRETERRARQLLVESIGLKVGV